MQKRLTGLRWFVFLLLIFPFAAIAQTRSADSLKFQIHTLADPQKKLAAIFLFCDQYNSIQPDTILAYYHLGQIVALNLQDNSAIIRLQFYENIALIKKGQLDKAYKNVDSILGSLSHDNDKSLYHKFLSLKSSVLIKSNKQKEAIENSFMLLQSAEKSNDTVSQLKARINIGWAYMELDQSGQALKWFNTAASLDAASSRRYSFASLYSNMAAVYDDLHNADSAEFYIKQAIQMALKNHDLTFLANAYNIYADINIHAKNNVKAEAFLKEGLKIRRQISDPFFIVSDIYQLGVFYANNHQPAQGIAIVEEGISIAERFNLSAKLPILYQALAENYKQSGDMTKYSEVLSKIISLKDSIYEHNTAEALSDIQTKYEIQKKENTIIQQKLGLARKNSLIYIFLGLLVITMIASFFVIQNRRKNQLLKLQEMAIDQKKKTTEAVMHAEENERKRIAEDLHDSVAQKMVVAKLNLEAFGGYFPSFSEKQQSVFDNISTLVSESVTEVRSLSHTMMPQVLVRSGLTEAIKNFISKIENKNLQIRFDIEESFNNIEKNKEIMIYRIVQECVQNVLKHANATKLDITLLSENNHIDITIEDNGAGFAKGQSSGSEGMGMKIMQSRVDFLNGKMEISSEPGMGSIIAFSIPGVFDTQS